MRILVANDDGIYSPGIAILAEVASKFGEVRVVAPDVERSSAGHSITAMRPLSYRRTPIGKFEAYRVDGKPRPLEAGMVFTVEPGIYVAPDKGEIELTLLEYDVDEWNERRIRLGRKAAAALEKEEKEAAEKIIHQVPSEFLGIGVRIEDDILITANGMENMTLSVPKDVDEVEALCAEAPTLPLPA